MKATVDLTEDRMFPDVKVSRAPAWMLGKPDKWDSTFKLVTFSFRIPWETDTLHSISSDEDFVDWRFQLSGSAKEYRRREELRQADSIDYCDRCGRRIRTPWRWDRTLCDTCTIQLEIDVSGHKVPWSDEVRSELTTTINII